MIRTLEQTDINGLNNLPPLEWRFDYENFLHTFLEDDFFYAFLMIEEGGIIGTGNVIISNNVSWLSNIIVLKEHQGNGLGTKITKFLMEFSRNKGCQTQLLIATELGEYVYKKLGFKKLSEYLCFDSVQDSNYVMSNSIRLLGKSDLNKVLNLDLEINGEDRTHLICKFDESGVGYFDSQNELIGFYLPNFGRGLIVSTDKVAGLALLKLKHSVKGRRTQLPIENKAGISFLENFGLKKGNKTSKMIYGQDVLWHPENIYSYAGGYCG